MEKRNSFKGSIGFVLAAAGSAVGLGNIWRFPYLAAKDGGGLFLVVYLVLAVTFGFTLLTTEVAIGRKTKQSPLTAYGFIHKKWKKLGILGCLIPMIILPYYCAIGGWVLKYLTVYLTGQGVNASQDGYFGGFITSTVSPIIFMAVFMGACAYVIIRGVNNGIEKMSRIIMPALVILVIIISIFALTIKFEDANGLRTGMQGFKIYVIPDFSNITIGGFLSVVVDAMGQLFYSLSVAMGIMIAYGSYVSDDSNLVKSINQIEIFDTLIAFLAGVMTIPAVFVFMGREGMTASGPGLMFVSLPKVFVAMGPIGNFIGIIFFIMVLFAALTSAISILEAVVSSIIDKFHVSRTKATIIETIIAFLMALTVCFGYNVLYFEYELPNGSVAQVLDIMDYISNNVLMPVVAICTCVLIGWIVKPDYIVDECVKNGEKFGREKLYRVMIKYVAPVMLVVLLLKAVGLLPNL